MDSRKKEEEICKQAAEENVNIRKLVSCYT